jgi:hypothetical protein
MGLTLLAHSGLSNTYWVDAFLTAIYIINRLPTLMLNHSSPYEKLFHQVPNYSILRVFGCKCFPLLRPYTNHKLEYRSKACIFLGYSHAGYRCLDPLTKKVYLSHHVVFNENSFPAKEHALLKLPSRINAASDASFMIPVSLPLSTSFPNDSFTTEQHVSPTSSAASEPSIPNPSSPQLLVDPLILPDPASAHSSTSAAESSPTHLDSHSSDIAPTPDDNPLPNHSMVTQSRTGSLKPKTFADYQLFYSTKHPPTTFLTTVSTTEPTCYSKAISDPRWKTAMSQEYDALITNHTWTLYPRPLQHNVIKNK